MYIVRHLQQLVCARNATSRPTSNARSRGSGKRRLLKHGLKGALAHGTAPVVQRASRPQPHSGGSPTSALVLSLGAWHRSSRSKATMSAAAEPAPPLVLDINGDQVPVTCAPGIDLDKVTNSMVFKDQQREKDYEVPTTNPVNQDRRSTVQ